VESNEVGYVDEYGMTIIVQIDSSCTLTALSMTRMTSITQVLLAISLLILHLLCHLAVTRRMKTNILAVLHCDLDSRMFTWCIRPLHMHRPIIITQNVVTEIKKNLTRNKIGKQLPFSCDQMLKMTV
jgi:hypothetical protein